MADGGGYPADAYGFAISLFLAAQALAFVWFRASGEVWAVSATGEDPA